MIIPVYNELPYLPQTLARVLTLNMDKEVIVMDDGSSDGTREWLAKQANRAGLVILFHPFNQGKGAALATGFAQAQGQ